MKLAGDCREFRAALWRSLEGLPIPEKLTVLSWHEHLLSCADCRELLEREEALEQLLATLPDPKLPPELTRRLMVRLKATTDVATELEALLDLAEAGAPKGLADRVRVRVRSELALDALLERDSQLVVPEGLAQGVLAGIHTRAERELDGLLELESEIRVPVGLSARILSRLESARPELAEAGHAWGSVRALRVYAAAAGLTFAVVSFAAWRMNQGDAAEPFERTGTEIAAANTGSDEEPDPQLLADFDLIEEVLRLDDLGPLMDDDLDLALSDQMSTEDEVLLTYLVPEEDSETSGSDG